MPPDANSRIAILVALVAIVLLPIGASVRGDELLLKVGDAYVAAADDGRGWTIGNPFIRYSLGVDGGQVGVREIYDPVSDRVRHVDRRGVAPR